LSSISLFYAAERGRSRALDRYWRMERLSPGSDEARVLDAMRRARFSIWRIEKPHEVAGVIVLDVLRECEAWLIDEGLETSGSKGMSFAARLGRLDDFCMTSGVVVPVNRALIEEVALDDLAWRSNDPNEVAATPRFAAAIYRAAIASGVMENVRYE